MMLEDWVIVLNLLGLVLALLLVAETFRREPLWLRPEKGPTGEELERRARMLGGDGGSIGR